jgi:hypothetical protein
VSIAGIAAKVVNDRRESVMKLIQAYDLSAKTVHAILHKDLLLSVSRPAERSNCFTRSRRWSDPECDRRAQRRSPWLFDYLGQHSHCWYIGRPGVKRELAGLSLNQEASQKELEGVRKMARRQTSLRRSGGSKIVAKNILTLPDPTVKKA